MKKKINFIITVGSYFPKRHSDYQHIFPVGGEQETHTFEFETDKPENAMDDAFKTLATHMGNTGYHIWYWSWIE